MATSATSIQIHYLLTILRLYATKSEISETSLLKQYMKAAETI